MSRKNNHHIKKKNLEYAKDRENKVFEKRDLRKKRM